MTSSASLQFHYYRHRHQIRYHRTIKVKDMSEFANESELNTARGLLTNPQVDTETVLRQFRTFTW